MVTNDYVTIANGNMEDEFIRRHHKHDVKEHQCSSSLVKHIKAPVPLVWSLVRRFDQPQKYKPFVSRCIVQGDLRIGSVREVNVKSGLPATTSTERLELLDDEEHIFSMKIVGGDHRLKMSLMGLDWLLGCELGASMIVCNIRIWVSMTETFFYADLIGPPRG
ncbi:ABSCISIC ACID RECEPTOR PYL5 [Salix purpurea]|uniref:ABSCISIC ACID RECEPTOR PYL5 n=1 Tax=Salix purpurea TaxID=77065 RepID=A0A9Q0QF03_SALPP|nr:ABSCISIC ACID RECEPTOR PYL5 [Salix purpurea]